MNITPKLGLRKPEDSDFYNVEDFNYNMDIIDNIEVSGTPVIAEADWEEMTTEQKKSYGLAAIQTASSGYYRGYLINGADYNDYPYTLITSGSGVASADVNISVTGSYKLLVIAINSEASTYELDVSVKRNTTDLTGQTLSYNQYTADTSADNRRNNRVVLYDITVSAGDVLHIALDNRGRYSAFVYAIIESDISTLSKAITQPDHEAEGSYANNALVVYGTMIGNSGGTFNIDSYTSGDTVQTDPPGYSYTSSYIFWLL